jgi:hypothetical protein
MNGFRSGFDAMMRSRIKLGEGSMFEAWQRVFGSNQVEPQPAALLEHLQQQGFEVTGHFRGDDRGWFSAEIEYSPDLPQLTIERYLADEEGIRGELNTWAAYLETEVGPEGIRLMQQIIGTSQLFALEQPFNVAQAGHAVRLSETLCRFLACATDGIYQVDGMGFFAADGTMLIDDGAL